MPLRSFELIVCRSSEIRKEVVFEIKIKRLEGLPASRRSFIRTPSKGQWYATLTIGAVSERTQPETRGPNGVVTWEQTFTFKLAGGSKFMPKVALWQAHKRSNDERVAVGSVDLVEMSQMGGMSVELCDPEDERKCFGRLFVDVQLCLPDVKPSSSSLVAKTNMSPAQFVKIGSGCQSWQPFLQAFRQAVEVARQISQLDPTAKVALSAIAFAITALVKQVERDQRVNELQEIMTSLLLFFSDVEPLRHSPFLRGVLDRLLCQVSECTYFVLQYREIESFVERTAIHLTTDTDSILNRFFTTFTTIRTELALGTSLQTTINTEYILNKVNEIDVFLHIKSFQHLTGCSWRHDKKCKANTRDFTINRILRWISSFQPGVFVLDGMEGAGKSALLHDLAGILDGKGRLGAGIFLNEHTEGKRSADSLMRTILYYLASSHPRIGKKIASAISQHPSLDYADAHRYGILLKEISGDLVLYGPLVVIVDGLHELQTLEDQAIFKDILGQISTSMNRNIRFVLSLNDNSPPDHGVAWWLDSLDSALLESGTVVENAIRASGSHELLRICGPKEELTSLIARYSLGSTTWLEAFYEVLTEVYLAKLVIDGLKISIPATTMSDAVQELSSIVYGVLTLTGFDIDFGHLSPGSRLFTSPSSTKQTAQKPDLLRWMKKMTKSSVNGLEEYEVSMPRCLSELLYPAKPPLLPTDSPLNVYQVHLHDISGNGQGPVHARIALPVSKPLVNGRDIKNEFQWYGVLSRDFEQMLANSPLEGCEWTVLPQELFQSETKDGCTSVMATTPAMTHAILRRLVCVWVNWGVSTKEGSCIRVRDGKEETIFLGRDAFAKAKYRGTHSMLTENGIQRVDLQHGDQLQVRVKYDKTWIAKAVIAMALKY